MAFSTVVRAKAGLAPHALFHRRRQRRCKDTGVAKSQSIETATNKIEGLKATIQKHEAAATELKDAVAVLDGDIAGWQSDHEKITEIRLTEKADYEATHTDYSESIDALTRAIVAVEKTSNQKLSQLQSSFSFVQKLAGKKVPSLARFLLYKCCPFHASEPSR